MIPAACEPEQIYIRIHTVELESKNTLTDGGAASVSFEGATGCQVDAQPLYEVSVWSYNELRKKPDPVKPVCVVSCTKDTFLNCPNMLRTPGRRYIFILSCWTEGKTYRGTDINNKLAAIVMKMIYLQQEA